MVAGLRLGGFFLFTTFVRQHADQDNVRPANTSLVSSKVNLVDHMAQPKCDPLPFDICAILVTSRLTVEKKCKALNREQLRNVLVQNAAKWSFRGRARFQNVVAHYEAMSTNDLISAVANGLTLLQKQMIGPVHLKKMTDVEAREYLAVQVFHCTGQKKTLKQYRKMDTWSLVKIARCCRVPAQIKSAYGESCLEYDGERDVDMAECSAGRSQKWYLAGDVIKERQHFKCLELSKGGHVVASPCTGKKSQKWQWKGVQIKSISAGTCLNLDKEGLSAEDCEKKKGVSPSQHWYAVEGKLIRSFIPGKQTGFKKFLSCSADGNDLFLAKENTGTGREMWMITKGKGYWYHIQVAGGTLDGKKFLSANKQGTKVVLVTKDDRSGRQRWKIVQNKKEGDYYTIQVKSGVFGGGSFLSMAKDGSHMNLRREANTDEERWGLPLSFKAVVEPSPEERIAQKMDEGLEKKDPKDIEREKKARPLVYYTKRDRKSGWEVQLGKCKVLVGEPRPCIVSPFFPSSYRGEEVCIIKAPGTKELRMNTFKTEQFFDFIQIDREQYYGDLSKKKIPMQGNTIVWSSDFFEETKGWKICQHEAKLR